jgi:hypothetical protein
MRQLYNEQPWCVEEEEPAPAVLDQWAKDVKQLSGCTMIRDDQVSGSAASGGH